MIKLVKGEAPAVLQANAATWTSDLIAKLQSGLKPTDAEGARYRHPQIKSALMLETHGKCVYCESKLKHIHHGDVEHIVPKSLDPSLRFEWENLTIACEICNQNKSNKDPNVEYIIDPYMVDPADHLMFLGSMLYSLGTAYGKNTSVLLDLNRVDLIERRQERLDQIMGICETILRTDLPHVTRKALLADLISREAASHAPYSAMTRSTIRVLQERFNEL